MNRRGFLTSGLAQTLPEAPQDRDQIAKTFAYYTDHSPDFVMFRNTT